MSFNKKNAYDFDGLDQDLFLQEMDPQFGSLGAKYDREVIPEFSDPTDYPKSMPLNSSSNFNIKQSMSFLGKDKITPKRFQPYNRPTTSKSQHPFQSTSTSQNNQPGFTNAYANDKENSKVKQMFKMNSSITNKQNISFNVAKNKPNTSRSNFVMETTKVEDTRYLRQRMNLPGSRMRHLIGSVDQVLRWHKSVKNTDLHIMYEANGILECKRRQDKKHLLFIKGESGQILQAIFYEIDRPTPDCTPKSSIVVIGRMIGFRKMQAFDVHQINQQDHQAIQRLSFLSQRALNEALA